MQGSVEGNREWRKGGLKFSRTNGKFDMIFPIKGVYDISRSTDVDLSMVMK